MNFLKKLGSVLGSVNPVLGVVAGIVSAFIPQSKQGDVAKIENIITSDIGILLGIIANVEAIGQTVGLTGEQKLKAAAPLVAQAILGSAMLTGHKVANPDLFSQACTKIADGMATLGNSLSSDSIQTINKS